MVSVSFSKENQELLHKTCSDVVDFSHPVDDRLVRDDLMRDIKAEHRHRNAAFVHHFRSLGIHIDVKFCSRRPVAERPSAHQYDLVYIIFDRRIFNQSKCDVRKRSGRNERHFPFTLFHLIDDEIDCMTR